VAPKRVLKRCAKEFGASIRLNALNRERKFLQHPVFQKVNRIDSRAPGVKAQHAKACTIINGGVLEAALGDFHRIHLNAISRQRAAVPPQSDRRPSSHQWRSLMNMKNLPNGCGGQAKSMVPQQFGLDTFGAKLALIAQAQNQIDAFLI
jgi:hypothetical protein